MQQKPNIILITTDQQRYDSIGMHGSKFIQTPNLDRLGREGISFARAYCPNTVCTPSRVSIMTGQHLSRHGAYNIGTSAIDDSIFLSKMLRKNGYRTHHIGKGHWHPWKAPSPETQQVDGATTPFRDLAGFETAEISLGHGNGGTIEGHYGQWLREKGVDPEQFHVKALFESDYNGTGDSDLPVELHSGSWLVERTIAFLQTHDRKQPFYLNLGFQDPHHPHILPYNFTNRIDPLTIPLPDLGDDEQFLPEHIPHFHTGTLTESRFNGTFIMAGNGPSAWKPYFQDERKARWTRAYYYSMVQLIDEQLGQILNALDELGLAEDTLIVFTSDHGEMLGDHGIGQKGPLVYEGVTRIPLLIRYPRSFSPRGLMSDVCVSLVDLAPTIMDFAGVSDHVQRDGISLRPLLEEGKTLDKRKGVRIEYKEEPDRIRYKCWVTPEWKLAVYPGESFGELYHLRQDPGEKRNLYNQPEMLPIKQQLLMELLEDMERSEPLSARPSRV